MPSPASQPVLTVLCIDDQEDGLAIRKIFLETFGYRVLTAASGAEGLRLADQNSIDAVLLDYRMPEMDGEEVAHLLRERYPGLPILMLTGYAAELPDTVKSLVGGVITKGSPPAELLERLRSVLGREPERPGCPEEYTPQRFSEHVADIRKQVQRSREHTEQIKARIPRKGHGL